MFDIRYNIINVLRVFISALNLFFMLRVFGISKGSDIYLLATSIISSWQYIPLLFMGQFMPFYSDLKVKSAHQAYKFFNQTLLFSLLIGMLLFLICLVFLEPFIRCYTLNLDIERFNILVSVLKIMLISLIFIPVEILLEHLFIAEKKFIFGYVMTIIMTSIPVIALAYMMFFNTADIKLLALSYSVGVLLSVVFGAIKCYRKFIPLKFSFNVDLKYFKEFIFNSASMYLGKSIEACLLPMVLNNFLVNFSQGVVSNFYYVRNTLNATNMISTDYSNRNIMAELSSFIANKDIVNIKKVIKKYLIFVPFIFLLAAFATYLVLPLCFKVIFYRSSNILDIKQFTNMFLALIPWFVMSLYATPFNTFNTLNKKSGIVILSNAAYVFTTGLILFLCSKNIYNIAFALAIAQIFYFLVNWYYTDKALKTKKGTEL